MFFFIHHHVNIVQNKTSVRPWPEWPEHFPRPCGWTSGAAIHKWLHSSWGVRTYCAVFLDPSKLLIINWYTKRIHFNAIIRLVVVLWVDFKIIDLQEAWKIIILNLSIGLLSNLRDETTPRFMAQGGQILSWFWVDRGSKFSRFSRIWCHSRKYFNKNFDTSHYRLLLQRIYSRNFFNKIVKNSNSRKFRPAKYKCYTVFTVPKDWSVCPIVSLRPLNQYNHCQTVVQDGGYSLQQGDWMISINLKDAYMSVLMPKEHRKFQWEDKPFQRLPFDLSSAPQISKSLLKWANGNDAAVRNRVSDFHGWHDCDGTLQGVSET